MQGKLICTINSILINMTVKINSLYIIFLLFSGDENMQASWNQNCSNIQ